MSLYINRATMSLLNMTHEMYRKNIEISRITKSCALLLMSGLSKYDIDSAILKACLHAQQADGGFIGNTDTLWNIKLLEYYPEFQLEREAAIQWLTKNNGSEAGLGRSKRDMHRIPVTGLALYLLPRLADKPTLDWLETTWLSEKNSLTYKAAYTLLAFYQSGQSPNHPTLLHDTENWILSQQQKSGGFAPWLNHPVGENVYCTAIAVLGLMGGKHKVNRKAIENAYNYLCTTQLPSGIWPYHEIEDGAAWGLFALSQCELYLDGEQ